ncbi:hypothetical protein AHMF7605_26140 [Adhaeribacter arboris]|uniref:Uncharacterized protein n=1 Tax=Adhaeribacter arboris TaxID=2072846 RepID=A0A2T2YML8_9BACT|nr:hypothetical protein [Adhaeribacter arboris]PSR56726.1 hypothetical protein AHMF7605_26140 [Adhaeribacter arboris]
MQINKQTKVPAGINAEKTASFPPLTRRIYSLHRHCLEIDFSSNYLLYNATAMARLFGQDPALFLRTPQIQEVIAAHLAYPKTYQVLCLNSNLPWTGLPENKIDLVLQISEGLVWVNAFLALRLATFLGSTLLECWVLETRNAIRAEVRRSKRRRTAN